MKFKLSELRTLRLSENESAVLRCLRKEHMNVADISRGSRLPRMTVYSSLSSLFERGLVEKIPRGKRYVYALTEPAFTVRGKAINDTKYAQHIEGTAEILKKYHALLLKHSGKRVLAIQSAKSARYLLIKEHLVFLNQINADIKKNKIIMDVITSRALVELSSSQSPLWKKNMEGRTTGVTILSEELIDFHTELWIFESELLVTNWEKELCVVIKDRAMVDMLRTMHAGLKKVGVLFDTNEYLRRG